MVVQLWRDSGRYKVLLADDAGTPKPVSDHVDCCCPEDECEECNFDTKPSQWIVDLGAGPFWTDDRCDYCDQVGGQYTLDDDSGSNAYSDCIFGGTETVCGWIYELDNPCSDSVSGSLRITLFHDRRGVGWKWSVCVWLTMSTATELYSFRAFWSSDVTESVNCWDLGGEGALDKIQLTLDSEGSSGNAACTATPGMPTNIDIWVPA